MECVILPGTSAIPYAGRYTYSNQQPTPRTPQRKEYNPAGAGRLANQILKFYRCARRGGFVAVFALKNTALATIANVQKSYRKERSEFATNATILIKVELSTIFLGRDIGVISTQYGIIQ